MTKSRNTKAESDALHEAALRIVTPSDRAVHDETDSATAKAYRTAWQNQLRFATGCAAVTARSHIAKALRRRRWEVEQ